MDTLVPVVLVDVEQNCVDGETVTIGPLATWTSMIEGFPTSKEVGEDTMRKVPWVVATRTVICCAAVRDWLESVTVSVTV